MGFCLFYSETLVNEKILSIKLPQNRNLHCLRDLSIYLRGHRISHRTLHPHGTCITI